MDQQMVHQWLTVRCLRCTNEQGQALGLKGSVLNVQAQGESPQGLATMTVELEVNIFHSLHRDRGRRHSSSDQSE